MAELMRLSRPWLSASLRTRGSPLSPFVARSFATTPAARRNRPNRTATGSTSGEKMAKMQRLQALSMAAFLLPGTLVVPAFSRFPTKPKDFAGFLWLIIKNRFQALGSIVGLKAMSQPTIIISRPKLQLGRSQTVPTAQQLHRQMSQAMAAGDTETLRKICIPSFANRLIAKIQNRPEGVQYRWRLVQYNSRTPRLADFRAVTVPSPDGQDGQNRIVKQAVVTIDSTQEITRFDSKSKGAGSDQPKKRDLVEHIVIQADVDGNYVSKPWKIWGTTEESTYEQFLEEEAGYKSLMEKQQEQQQHQHQR